MPLYGPLHLYLLIAVTILLLTIIGGLAIYYEWRARVTCWLYDTKPKANHQAKSIKSTDQNVEDKKADR